MSSLMNLGKGLADLLGFNTEQPKTTLEIVRERQKQLADVQQNSRIPQLREAADEQLKLLSQRRDPNSMAGTAAFLDNLLGGNSLAASEVIRTGRDGAAERNLGLLESLQTVEQNKINNVSGLESEARKQLEIESQNAQDIRLAEEKAAALAAQREQENLLKQNEIDRKAANDKANIEFKRQQARNKAARSGGSGASTPKEAKKRMLGERVIESVAGNLNSFAQLDAMGNDFDLAYQNDPNKFTVAQRAQISVDKFKELQTRFDKELQELVSRTGIFLTDYLKSKSGATVTDKERADMEAQLPRVGDSKQQVDTKIKTLKDLIEKHIVSVLDTNEAAGRDVGSLKDTLFSNVPGSRVRAFERKQKASERKTKEEEEIQSLREKKEQDLRIEATYNDLISQGLSPEEAKEEVAGLLGEGLL